MNQQATQTRDVVDHLGKPRSVFSHAYKKRVLKAKTLTALSYVLAAVAYPALIAFMQLLDYVDGVR